MGYLMVGGRRPALSSSMWEVSPKPVFTGDFSLCGVYQGLRVARMTGYTR